MDDNIYAIWFSRALGAGSVHGGRLIEKYGSFKEIYKLKETDYIAAGIKSDTAVMARLLDKSLDEQQRILSFCVHNYFDIIEYTSNMYPERLRVIKDPPPVLYTRGRMIDFDDNLCIAVVGTRSYSDAGWNSTYKIASGLAQGGAIVVTGLASGIDTAATRAALEASNFAVGVLGSGLEKIFPSENRELFEEMYRNGLLISELPPFSEITGRYFPVRNRIISGLCNGVLVGEGSTRSGAMITAAHAAAQGRHIYAIPGDLSSEESTGVNKLIREGATPVFDGTDILERYKYLYSHRITNASAVADRIEVPEERSTKRVRVLTGKSGTAVSAVKEEKSVKVAESTAAKTVSSSSVTAKDGNVSKSKSDGKKALMEAKKALDNKKEPKVIMKNALTTVRGIKAPETIPELLEMAKKFQESEKKNGKNPKRNPSEPVVFEKIFESRMEIVEEAPKASDKNEEALSKLSDSEKKIYEFICKKGKTSADAICGETGVDPMNVNVALTSLEMLGLVETVGPNVILK